LIVVRVSVSETLNIIGLLTEHRSPETLNIIGLLTEHRSPETLNIIGLLTEHRSPETLNIIGLLTEHRSPGSIFAFAKNDFHFLGLIAAFDFKWNLVAWLLLEQQLHHVGVRTNILTAKLHDDVPSLETRLRRW